MKRIDYQELIRSLRKIKNETEQLEILDERYYAGKAVVDVELNDNTLENTDKKHFLNKGFEYASSYKIQIREDKLFFTFVFEFDEAHI